MGYSLWPDDPLCMAMAGHEPLEQAQLIGFKQRWLVHAYHCNPGAAFYSAWSWLHGLCLGKAMLLSPDLLLIKLLPLEPGAPLARLADTCPPGCCFALWSLSLRQVLKSWRANGADFFTTLYQRHFYAGLTPTPANSVYEQYWLQRQLDLYAAAKEAGYPAARRRLLASFPHSQSSDGEFISPYLDTNLFRYDDKSVGGGDRPRPATDYPLCWFHRDTNQKLFSLNTHDEAVSQRKYVTWLFHPHLPLALSYSHGLLRPTSFNLYYHATEERL